MYDRGVWDPISGFGFWAGKRGTCVWRRGGRHRNCEGREWRSVILDGGGKRRGWRCSRRGPSNGWALRAARGRQRKWRSARALCPVIGIKDLRRPPARRSPPAHLIVHTAEVVAETAGDPAQRERSTKVAKIVLLVVGQNCRHPDGAPRAWSGRSGETSAKKRYLSRNNRKLMGGRNRQIWDYFQDKFRTLVIPGLSLSH
jgi:hypothetical protein